MYGVFDVKFYSNNQNTSNVHACITEEMLFLDLATLFHYLCMPDLPSPFLF